jgi:hypothetical protein
MENHSDIKGLYGKINKNPATYQELASLRKSEVHISRWTLLHDIHAEYQAAAIHARLLDPLEPRKT